MAGKSDSGMFQLGPQEDLIEVDVYAEKTPTQLLRESHVASYKEFAAAADEGSKLSEFGGNRTQFDTSKAAAAAATAKAEVATLSTKATAAKATAPIWSGPNLPTAISKAVTVKQMSAEAKQKNVDACKEYKFNPSDAIKMEDLFSRIDLNFKLPSLHLDMPKPCLDAYKESIMEKYGGREAYTGGELLYTAYRNVDGLYEDETGEFKPTKTLYELKGANIGDATRVTKILKAQGFPVTTELIDAEAEYLGAVGKVDLAVAWRDKKMTGWLMEMLTPRNRREVTAYACIQAAKNGDLDMCDHLCRLHGASNCRLIESDIISNLMAYYHFEDNNTTAYSVISAQLLALFEFINPNWDRDPYDSSITSFKYYIGVSDDIKTILLRTVKSIYVALESYVSVDRASDIVSESFPQLEG